VPAGTRANSFEYIHETDQIAGYIFVWTGKGVPYSGLCCEMNHGFELAIAEKTFHPSFICEIKREKPESGPHAELPKPRILEPGIVIIVEVVYTDNFKPILEKPADDEPRGCWEKKYGAALKLVSRIRVITRPRATLERLNPKGVSLPARRRSQHHRH